MGTLASGSIDLKSLKVAGEGASKYITSIDSDSGIKVHAGSNSSLNYVQINSNGMKIYKTNEATTPSSKCVADFGEIVTIGNTNNSTYLTLSHNALELFDNDLDEGSFFSVEDARNTNGIATRTCTFKGDGVQTEFTATFANIKSVISVRGATTEIPTYSGSTFTFTVPPNGYFYINFEDRSSYLKSYNFGYLTSSEIFGLACGYNTAAVGPVSIAGGFESISYGNNSIAFGYQSQTGSEDTAQLSYGSNEGYCSIAVGEGVQAVGNQQTAIGRYNTIDSSTYAFIIGNGTNKNNRSNALTVGWDGALSTAGKLTVSSGGAAITGNTTISGSLTLRGHSSSVGTVVTGTNVSNLSLTSGTQKYVSSMSLTVGIWVVVGFVRFPANATGVRRLALNSSSSSTAIDVQLHTSSNNTVQAEVVKIITVNSTTTYYLHAFQNSGSSLTASEVDFSAVRII